MLLINEDLLKSRRYVIVQLPNNHRQTETTLKGLFLTKEQAELSLKAKDVGYKYLVKEIFLLNRRIKMNALNIMWLLNEVDCNTELYIDSTKTKHVDWINIKTNDFKFYIDETGLCRLEYLDQPKSVEKDIEYWDMVKTWVKKYYQENF